MFLGVPSLVFPGGGNQGSNFRGVRKCVGKRSSVTKKSVQDFFVDNKIKLMLTEELVLAFAF